MIADMSIIEDYIRIPLSLKVEKDELYFNLIQPARQDKSLTRLILVVLRAYYEDDEIRRLVDTRTSGSEILKSLNEEIDKVNMEHNKSVAQVNALKFDTAKLSDAEFVEVYSDKDAGNNAEPNLLTNSTMTSILNMLSNLTDKVDMLMANQNKTNTETQTVKFEEATSSLFDLDDIPDFDNMTPKPDDDSLYDISNLSDVPLKTKPISKPVVEDNIENPYDFDENTNSGVKNADAFESQSILNKGGEKTLEDDAQVSQQNGSGVINRSEKSVSAPNLETPKFNNSMESQLITDTDTDTNLYADTQIESTNLYDTQETEDNENNIKIENSFRKLTASFLVTKKRNT